jgi:hypothetical protein
MVQMVHPEGVSHKGAKLEMAQIKIPTLAVMNRRFHPKLLALLSDTSREIDAHRPTSLSVANRLLG